MEFARRYGSGAVCTEQSSELRRISLEGECRPGIRFKRGGQGGILLLGNFRPEVTCPCCGGALCLSPGTYRSRLVLGGICASIFSCHQQAPEWSCAGASGSVPPPGEHNVAMSQVLALPLRPWAWGQTPGPGTRPGKDPPGHKIGPCSPSEPQYSRAQ